MAVRLFPIVTHTIDPLDTAVVLSTLILRRSAGPTHLPASSTACNCAAPVRWKGTLLHWTWARVTTNTMRFASICATPPGAR